MKLRAFTLIEVLVVLGTLAIVILLVLPALRPPSHPAPMARCVQNLQQIGLAFRVWSTDHADRLPMAALTDSNGSLELVSGTNIFRTFQLVSNELNDPKVLLCPVDNRKPPKRDDFATLRSINLSYVLGLDAGQSNPGSVLSGDRNITNAMPAQNGILAVTASFPASWTGTMHKGVGNILRADGSVVRKATSAVLQSALITPTTPTNRLGLP
jgi:competence protein ComGC